MTRPIRTLPSLRPVVPVATALALILGACTEAAEQAPEMDSATSQVADGVFWYNAGTHNAFFVDTDDGVVAFDPISMEAAVGLASAIRGAVPAKPLAAIVYSHSDADHATGAPALLAEFGDAPIIAQENALLILLERADPDLPPPDLTFSDEMTLRFGSRAIELHYLGRSHSDNLIVAFLPEERVAFAVDFVSNDRVGYQSLPGWYFDEFYVALDLLLEIPFETMVFGHGDVGDRGTIERQLAYYADLRDAVQAALDDGLSEEEAMAQVRLDDYADWGQYEEWFPMNVGAIYRWLAES